eukprot:CAMPEP_0169088608 /NCGR_PEP_ID=MMETSP1015-20121227/14844_1 /TAXON_ID=342587 /ORGANISM="Karlodinium micrum, Strain CCMP2283" /LENGTH=120 /DNA_ID=CAMNT_0009148893 /DNA_START=134 /DNA_END=496 /DNA_ORIENTATION=-
MAEAPMSPMLQKAKRNLRSHVMLASASASISAPVSPMGLPSSTNSMLSLKCGSVFERPPISRGPQERNEKSVASLDAAANEKASLYRPMTTEASVFFPKAQRSISAANMSGDIGGCQGLL